MKKILMSLLPCYVVQNNSFIGPYVAKVLSVNVNYGHYTLILDTDQKIPLLGSDVYFTQFFANRKVKKMERELAMRLAIDEAERNAREAEATELEL